MPLKQTTGSRAQVMHGTAKKTSGGLTKSQLKYNNQGKIVSKKASALAKKNNRLVKAGYVTRKGIFVINKKKDKKIKKYIKGGTVNELSEITRILGEKGSYMSYFKVTINHKTIYIYGERHIKSNNSIAKHINEKYKECSCNCRIYLEKLDSHKYRECLSGSCNFFTEHYLHNSCESSNHLEHFNARYSVLDIDSSNFIYGNYLSQVQYFNKMKDDNITLDSVYISNKIYDNLFKHFNNYINMKNSRNVKFNEKGLETLSTTNVDFYITIKRYITLSYQMLRQINELKDSIIRKITRIYDTDIDINGTNLDEYIYVNKWFKLQLQWILSSISDIELLYRIAYSPSRIANHFVIIGNNHSKILKIMLTSSVQNNVHYRTAKAYIKLDIDSRSRKDEVILRKLVERVKPGKHNFLARIRNPKNPHTGHTNTSPTVRRKIYGIPESKKIK